MLLKVLFRRSIAHSHHSVFSFDHLIRPRGFEFGRMVGPIYSLFLIEHQLELCGFLDRDVDGLPSLQDLIYDGPLTPVHVLFGPARRT